MAAKSLIKLGELEKADKLIDLSLSKYSGDEELLFHKAVIL